MNVRNKVLCYVLQCDSNTKFIKTRLIVTIDTVFQVAVAVQKV